MLVTSDNIKAFYNGQNLMTLFNEFFTEEPNINRGLVIINMDSEPLIPFAASSNVSTARAMYRQQDIITSIQGESLSFTLTFAAVKDPKGSCIPIPWTMQMLDKMYRLFDTRDYKPLTFGDAEWDYFVDEPKGESNPNWDQWDHVTKPYYNCMAYAGSLSELKMFEDSTGYITIPFVCDAPHMWIDVVKGFSRVSGTYSAQSSWHLPNFSNVKDYSGHAYCYPVIEIFDFRQYSDTISDDTGFFAISNSEIVDENGSPDPDYAWFSLNGFPLINPNDPTRSLGKLVIDCYNQQIYGFDAYKNDTTHQIILDTEPNNINYIQYLNNRENYQQIRFFRLLEEDNSRLPEDMPNIEIQEGGGQPRNVLITEGSIIYHMSRNIGESNNNYKVRFTYSCPYMGGYDDSITYPGSEDDIKSVMLHTEDEVNYRV